MVLITEAVRNSIDELVEDLRYLTPNAKYKRKVGLKMIDDDVIATEKDARAVIEKIDKSIASLRKARSKITEKFNLV